MTVRCFICFELPESIIGELSLMQQRLKACGKGVRWANPEGIHLTLKFLGNVNEEDLDAVAETVRLAGKSFQPIPIRVTGIGAFPNFNRPRVYWVGIEEESGEMALLQNCIEDELGSLGFEREKRSFKPHLTMGRVKYSKNITQISELLQNQTIDEQFTAKQIVIMKSTLKPTGAVYTPLYRFPLGGKGDE